MEGDELDQMKVSDLEGSDNEKEQKLNKEDGLDKNNAAEALVSSSDLGSEEVTSNDTQVDGEKCTLQRSRASNEVCSASCLETNKPECEQELLETENKVSTMEISNSGNTEIISSPFNSEYLQRNTEEIARPDPSPTGSVELFSGVQTSDSEKEDQHSLEEMDVNQANDVSANVSSSVNEIVQGTGNLALNATLAKESEVVNGTSDVNERMLSNAEEIVQGMGDLTLKASVEKASDDVQTESVSSNSSVDCKLNSIHDASLSLSCTENPSKDNAVRDEGGESLEIKDEILAPVESLPGGNAENVATPVNENTSSTYRSTNISSSEVERDEIEAKANESDSERVKTDQDCVQEIEITANLRPSEYAKGNDIEDAANGSISDECGTDTEEDHGRDSVANRCLTLQPAYHPSLGECSVMSCLSQFCAAELLDGSNKFACEECSKRAQGLKNPGKGSNRAKKETNDDDKDDDSDDGKLKFRIIVSYPRMKMSERWFSGGHRDLNTDVGEP